MLCDITVARRFVATSNAVLLPQTQLPQRVKAGYCEIGSYQDLPDCSLSHKKWKLFAVFCREPGNFVSLAWQYRLVSGSAQSWELPAKLWHDRTALFSANIWVNGCGVVGQTLSRQFSTFRNRDQYNPYKCTHLYPVSLNWIIRNLRLNKACEL